MTGDGLCGDRFDGTGNLQLSGNGRDTEERIGRHLERQRLTGPDGPALPAVGELNLRDRDPIRTVIDLDLMAVELALCGGGPSHLNVHHSGLPGGDGDGTTDAPLDHDARRPLHLILAREGVTEGVVGNELRARLL